MVGFVVDGATVKTDLNVVVVVGFVVDECTAVKADLVGLVDGFLK